MKLFYIPYGLGYGYGTYIILMAENIDKVKEKLNEFLHGDYKGIDDYEKNEIKSFIENGYVTNDGDVIEEIEDGFFIGERA